VSIRHQLLLIALTTLILPWAGCKYARELDAAQRRAQENALAASAETISHALSSEPARVFRDLDDRAPFDAARGDQYVFALHNEPLIDGYREDWDLAAPLTALPSADGYTARLLLGTEGRFLYLYMEVDDARTVAQPPAIGPTTLDFTRVDLVTERPDGTRDAFFFASGAPGPLPAQVLVRGESGSVHSVSEARIQGFWLQTATGYQLEARIPWSLLGARLWIEAHAGDARHAGFEPQDDAPGGRLFMATPGLSTLLATFVRPGTRATVLDANALRLGVAGTLESGGRGAETRSGSWYDRFLSVDSTHWPLDVPAADRMQGPAIRAALRGHTSAEWLRTAGGGSVLRAAAPLQIGGEPRGAVVLEQGGNPLLEARDQALSHLFNLTLLGTALAVLFAFAVAASIGVTIGRLRLAADSAIGPDGRIRLSMPESQRSDEIGALALAFERLLQRLNEHTLYLRSLGGKLSHEMRTPLTIVRSSIDNLEFSTLAAEQRGYLLRARDGTARLQFILTALGAAARVEEAIKQAERVPLDLCALLDSAMAGYRAAFPGATLILERPENECPMRGAPELLVQLLDKLIENAVDFCPPGGTITVRLERLGSQYELSVANDGPPLPPAIKDRLFESLFEHRSGREDRPHFGLGLYIVRLIAEFHGGRVGAADRADGTGVVFSVRLPLI
jgi:dedicated sortase system histidine kinase